MALSRLTFIFLLQCIFVLNINCEGEFHETNDETYRPQIWSFLNYLNSIENRVYNYNYATLISAQNKDIDTTDLTIDIEVNCHQNSPKCITNVLQCSGTVQYNSEQAKYETLPSFTCGPKVRIDLSRDDDFSEEAEARPLEGEAPAEVDLTHEVATDGQTSGEQFIAIKPDSVYCLGCPVDLNTDVEGLHVLTDTALQHIESERRNKQAIVRVIRLQQQVVSGIKYILLLEIAPTTCPKAVEQTDCVFDSNAITEICEIVYFQQPWISKSKRIISNNCTESQEWGTDEATPPNSAANDLDNEIDVNYNYKKTAEYPDIVDATVDNAPNYDSLADTGHADDILKMSGGIMDPSRMKDVESQVIYHAPETELTAEPESVLTDEQKHALDGFLGMMGDQPRQKRSANDDNDSSSSSSSSSEEDDNNNDHKKKKHRHDNNNDDDDDDDHKTKHNDDDDDDDNDVHNKEKYSKKKKYHKEQEKNEENNDTSSSSSSSSSEEDTRVKRETSPNDSSVSSEEGKPTIKQKRDVTQSSEETTENTGDKSSSEEQAKPKEKRSVDEETNKNDSSSSDSSSDEQNNEDNRTKREIANPSSNEEQTAPKQASPESDESSEETKGTLRRKRNIRTNNHLVKVTPEEKNFVRNLATFAVNTLDNIDADTQKRVVLQVLAAKKSQELDGVLYHLTLRVGISRCEEEIEPEVNLTKINSNDEECKDNLMESLTKICKVQVQVNNEQENPKVIKSHCQNMKKDHVDSDVNRTYRSKRGGIPGGVSDVDPEDPKIQQYAKDLLVQMDGQDGDGKTSELIKIISVTKQVVQGYRYKFNVELKIGGASKKCLLDVWDQPWVKKDGKQVSVTCDKQPEQKYRFRRSHNEEEMGDLSKVLIHDIKIILFKAFAEQYNKTYATNTELKKRFQIFRKNIKMIKTLNDNEQGTATYGMTRFTDLTREEFKKYLGLRPELQNMNDIPYPNAQIPDIELPTEFDWRKKGAVSEVKNQGQCGSCWAFSVTGNIEGQNAIKTGKMIELSEQELVDCDKLDEGCNGGLPDNAYRAIEQLGGLETEKDYPYEAEDEKCHFNKSLTRVQIAGAVNISSDETDMAKWLVQNGPISIGINANAMQFYMGGVSHPWKFLCDPTTMDHGVLIVGYGVHKYPVFNKVLPYWIIKNSWGPTWGEQGYYRVYRGDGTCGVNQMASSAVL